MTKLTHNLGAKILSCFLVIITGFTAIGSGLAFYLADMHGFYSKQATPYHQSIFCENVTYDYAYRVINEISVGNIISTVESQYSPSRTNFRFTLVANDEIIADTFKTNGSEGSLVTSFPAYLEHAYTTEPSEESIPSEKSIEATIYCYVIDPPIVADRYSMGFRVYQTIYDLHDVLLPILLASLLLVTLSVVFLLCAADHQAGKEEITLNLQDKIPLDLYLLLTVGGSLGIGIMVLDGNPFNDMEAIIVGLAGLLLIAILMLATLLTMATRIKLGRYFYQNTLCYRLFCLCKKLFAWFWDALKAIPLMWKVAVAWLLLSCIYIAGEFPAVLLNLVLLFVFCTMAAQMQKLQKGGEALAKGDLKSKIDTQRMFPMFRRHGEHLNSVSKGFAIALNQKMKSERLKTELITNVSHDIKTPLTSIINYVDLLKKEELTGQAAEYVEVLDRQSTRLKKLTEDLVEASKASTGNIKANLEPTDMGELVTQAVAEYEEKLEKAVLEVVISGADAPVFAMADGNLTWRVLSNLLSNACKYSQPNTRVYIDIQKKDALVTLSMKNISKDPLNIPVDELMERFVRGDSSRHTEGSGLGLNITQSLVHLQKGKFALNIDGDLFKAYMKFPAAEPPAPPEEEIETTEE